MKTTKQDSVDIKQLIALEEELSQLKQTYGCVPNSSLFQRIGDWLADKTSNDPILLHRKTYIYLALFLGWFIGAHRFYAKQKWLGISYLLFFWTGIPFAMTFIDLMIVLPMNADENGMILL